MSDSEAPRPQRVHRLGFLDKGSFSKVYRAKWKDRIVALRVQHETVLDTGSNITPKELSLLIHPNVVRQLAWWMSKDRRLVQVLEYCSQGDLYHQLKEYPEKDGRLWCLDVMRGLVYLHEKNIVHLDIKTENCLVSVSGTARVADFDFARTRGHLVRCRSTRLCLAPELELTDDPVPAEFDMDVWSVAILITEMVTRQLAYKQSMRDYQNRIIMPPPGFERSYPRDDTRPVLEDVFCYAPRMSMNHLLTRLDLLWRL